MVTPRRLLANIIFYAAFSVGAREVTVAPVSSDLLSIDGNNLYIENVFVRKVNISNLGDDVRGIDLLNVRVEGLEEWDKDKLQGMYQCEKEDLRWMLPTQNPEIWGFDDKWCSQQSMRICLTDRTTRRVCSAWLQRPDYKPLIINQSRMISSDQQQPQQRDAQKSFTWNRADGSYVKFYKLKDVVDPPRRKSFPTFYQSLLLSGVATVEDALYLGTGQFQYWPAPSERGQMYFEPQRIGGQIRVSQPLNSVELSDGRVMQLRWFDMSVNYRKRPNGVFDDHHLYAFMMYSNYSLLSRTTVRAGGGVGLSVRWPDQIIGFNVPGHIFSYIDFSFLPLDLSNDSRGIIVSSKANGIWLFPNNWFATGDVEMRLLNFTLKTENSVMRIQFGGGYAF